MSDISLDELKNEIQDYFGFKDITLQNLNTAVNDIYSVSTPTGKFALKLYNTSSRTRSDIEWELALNLHLIQNQAPVVKPVRAKEDYINRYVINREERLGILFEWAHGEKPKPSPETYISLGKAAALIHQAADSFTLNIKREQYDIQTLIDEQLQRMQPLFEEANKWNELSELANRIKKNISNESLDQGICHMDLTLDNIHVDGENITVFDFDSAGKSWRAIEPHGVLRFSKDYFKNWLEGYRSVRQFSLEDEKAVYSFVIIGDLRIVAWKLGVAKSSRGIPLLTPKDLPKVLEEWLSWERVNNLTI